MRQLPHWLEGLQRPGPLPWIIGFLAAFGFILASYVTKEFGIRTGEPYPNDVLNRLKRRDLSVFVICLGAVVARPFGALTIAAALAHLCVIGVLRNSNKTQRRGSSRSAGNRF